jgi:sugar O-acyltransferase (sialic acid O-acetyltransferase NeuD family)
MQDEICDFCLKMVAHSEHVTHILLGNGSETHVARKQIVIWGAGGHASVVADIVRQGQTHEIACFVDDSGGNSARGRVFLGVRVLGDREELAAMLRRGVEDIVIAIGDCEARLSLAQAARGLGFRLWSAVHPRAIVALSAEVGTGAVIAAGAVIGPGTTLGENVIVNSCASVDHDCRLAEGVHICPGTHLAGRVEVGRAAWVGIGSTVIDRVRIGQGACVAAGAVVTGEIPDRVLARGVPARVVRKLPPGWSPASSENYGS